MFELPTACDALVVGIDGVRGDFTVTTRTPDGITSSIRCRTVVLATGGTSHPRRLGVPGEDLASVHTHLGDPHRFFGRRVMVVRCARGSRNQPCRVARLRRGCWGFDPIEGNSDRLHLPPT